MTYRTRFAPSPTGPLHLGHAYSALIGAQRAMQREGTFLVRIEDLDQSRARSAWEDQIHSDLAWLGLSYPRPVMRQSERHSAYARALSRLWDNGLLYPCTCKRRDILEALAAPQEGAEMTYGPDGIVYPGTCRRPVNGSMPDNVALRLNIQLALDRVGAPKWQERGCGPLGESGVTLRSVDEMVTGVGDIVVRRKGMEAAYHIAVVVDDAAQQITEVVRGQDLFEATAIHVILQRLLGLPSPEYYHHDLVRDESGKRLAKRDDARSILSYRDAGWTQEDVRARLGLLPSVIDG